MSRIANLPVRDWEANKASVITAMTAAIRTDTGSQEFFGAQAVALLEAAENGGVFAALPVGGGKTALSLLLAHVLKATRPLVVVPKGKKMVEKTLDEFRLIREHWQAHSEVAIQVCSYNRLSLRKDRPRVSPDGSEVDYENSFLWKLRPDVIILDEAHSLKNFDAIRTQTFQAYLDQFPETIVCAMTGSFCKEGLLDYAHILNWCLKERSPIPRQLDICELWARNMQGQFDSGFSPDYEAMAVHLGRSCSDPASAREAFQLRLNSAPGVIISKDTFTGTKLTVEPRLIELPQSIQDAFSDINGAYLAPDGWPLANAGKISEAGDDQEGGGAEAWRLKQELANWGGYYKHAPWPPEEYMKLRSEWCSFERIMIQQTNFQSSAEIRQACALGHLDSEGLYARWREMEPTFKITRVPEQISDHILVEAKRWANALPNAGGIVWVRQRALGRYLTENTGWRYFAEGGTCAADGSSIRHARGSEIVIASIQACGEGYHLPQWHYNLITCPMSSPIDWEQLLGRTHRTEQKHDVSVVYLMACQANYDNVTNARYKAEFNVAQQLAQPQKILTSGFFEPIRGQGPQWETSSE